MNTTLAVVVSAIVILITALVVITIFSGGVGQVGTLTNARTICETQARSSCMSTGQMPLTWNIPTVSIPVASGGNKMVACSSSEATGKSAATCDGNDYPTATGGGSVATCSGSCINPNVGGTCPSPKTNRGQLSPCASPFYCCA